MQKISLFLFFVAVSLFSTAYTADKPTKEPMVIISTSLGDIKVKLYNETPYHRDNFLKLAKEAYYDNTLFHRVIKGFMIQGGDPDSKNATPEQSLGMGGPGYTLPAEINPNLFHKKGALSAARTGDQMNPQRRSSGSQFYVVQGKTYTDEELKQMEARGFVFSDAQKTAYKTIGGTPFLDAQYTVFGEVVEGLDVLDKIAATETKPGDRPAKDVKMTVKIVE
ncbi:MAG: peptidylprolyl isomerase [Chitinophagales bacterium]|jgi:peptidyl-prolyl cis-trans isomerase B (cyclophilin B)|nr:peptidylprolyl isomerase [Chitinophagales bacterium]HNI43662.1 peptidylprolyl isomerase [Chitinophagales bacterium]HNL06058.1 peptidylprolyl isomerase [Chitinophagales bacterium]